MHFDGGARQLTYCTNIHPANGWAEVRANLEAYAPALKARYSPDAPFGLGLRLSAAEAREVLTGGTLGEFRDFLDSQGLYVALINGYPYGHFSGEPVKAEVFAPDWRSEERVRYTLDLVEILAALLPEGTDGGVSTVPLSYKPWIAGEWQPIVANLGRVCDRLARLRQETGRMIHIDIEPEPDGLIETTAETLAFFTDRLPQSVDAREHLRVCYDTCHFAVEYEDPAETFAAFERAGVRIGRVQISSALAVPLEQGGKGCAGPPARTYRRHLPPPGGGTPPRRYGSPLP